MKAQDFLALVERMLQVQREYLDAKHKGSPNPQPLLIRAKELERQVSKVVQEGVLQPDFILTMDSATPLDESDFVRLVRDMRKAQKRARKSLHSDDAITATLLATMVDNALINGIIDPEEFYADFYEGKNHEEN